MMKRDEFEADYARRSGISVERLRALGRVPRYVSHCFEYDEPHWEMGRVTDDDFDRRNEIPAPGADSQEEP